MVGRDNHTFYLSGLQLSVLVFAAGLLGSPLWDGWGKGQQHSGVCVLSWVPCCCCCRGCGPAGRLCCCFHCHCATSASHSLIHRVLHLGLLSYRQAELNCSNSSHWICECSFRAHQLRFSISQVPIRLIPSGCLQAAWAAATAQHALKQCGTPLHSALRRGAARMHVHNSGSLLVVLVAHP